MRTNRNLVKDGKMLFFTPLTPKLPKVPKYQLSFGKIDFNLEKTISRKCG